MAVAAVVLKRTVGRLFTGESSASRGFQLAVAAAAAALVARMFLFTSTGAALEPPFAGPAAAVAAGLAVALAALGGFYPLPLGHKIHLSLGSSAAFATLLIFPPQQALLLAFAGTSIAQAVRWKRENRLTLQTILFNLAQYLVTWSLAAEIYHRAQAAPVLAQGLFSWVPVAAAGAVYLLVNTWVVTTWAALRRRAWTWDLWIRALREAGAGYVASLCLGAAAAGTASMRPLLVLMLAPALILLRGALVRISTISLRQTSAAFAVLVELVERGSPYTTEHSERVSWWAQRLARHLGLSEDEVETVAIAAKLHDLGKAMMPRSLEEKPGPLTAPEMRVIQQHPAAGAEVVATMAGMQTVAAYIRHHHERYDGDGYPGRLQGEDIPLGARIIAVADTFDALRAPRSHRPALSVEDARARLAAGMGTQFDPRVALALLELTRGQTEEQLREAFAPRLSEGVSR
ncbi:MAG: HD-GYP domain-containing protein [Armatimonadetes bacterium]|nr:HD-GYP domain-containing protein [Armatimonadota bacterium]